MESLKKNRTWDLVKIHVPKKLICSKWVFKSKNGIPSIEDSCFKVRVMAKGFSQIPGVDYTDMFSPMVKHNSIRALLGIVAHHDHELEQHDVKTAFLNGYLEEEIYMEQPKGIVDLEKKDLFCKLKRSLYGLKQSPR